MMQSGLFTPFFEKLFSLFPIPSDHSCGQENGAKEFNMVFSRIWTLFVAGLGARNV